MQLQMNDLLAIGNTVRENGPTPEQRAFVCEVSGFDLPERLQGQYARLFSHSPQMVHALRAFLASVDAGGFRLIDATSNHAIELARKALIDAGVMPLTERGGP